MLPKSGFLAGAPRAINLYPQITAMNISLSADGRDTVHPIIEIMKNVILPNVRTGVGQIVIPAENRVRNMQDYIEIFPFGLHQHDQYEWLWLLHNSGHINVEGSIRHLDQGDFCLLPPHAWHAEVYTRTTKPYQTLWCGYFHEALFCRVFSFNAGQLRVEATRAVLSPPSLISVLSLLEGEIRCNLPHGEDLRKSILETLVLIMLRALESSLVADNVEDLPGFVARRVLDYLNHHYARKVSLAELGRAVGMGRSNLCAAFKAETGKTIGDALTEIRLENAKLLLLANQLSVQDVSRAVGYGSTEHFCRIFHRFVKVPPSRFGKW